MSTTFAKANATSYNSIMHYVVLRATEEESFDEVAFMRRALPFVLLSVLILLPVSASGEWDQVGEGIHYQYFRLDNPPNDAFVARMQLDNPNCIIDSTIARGRISGRSGTFETVSGMAKRYNGALNGWDYPTGYSNKVIAAINGDYFSFRETDRDPYRSQSGQIHSGWFCRRYLEYSGGSGFVFKQDRNVFLGGNVSNGEKYNDSTQTVTLGDGSVMKIDRLNAVRGENELVLYTPQYGDSTGVSPDGVEVLVQLSRPLGPNERVSGTVRSVHLNAQGLTIPFDCIVLSAHGSAAASLADGVRPNQEVSLFPQFKDESGKNWSGAYAGIAGAVVLVKNGKVPVDEWVGKSWKDAVHPRTCIAWNSNHFFFVVVDGRSQRSRGMTFEQLGVFCRSTLGAEWALAQDGGGSSALVINGKVMNTPSDGQERRVANGYMMVNLQPAERSQTFSQNDTLSLSRDTEMRLGPGMNHGLVASLPQGTTATIQAHLLNGILATGSHWWNARSGNQQGWISEEPVTAEPDAGDLPHTPKDSNSVVVAFTNATLEIDGLLDEPAWRNAGRVRGFLLAEGDQSPEDDTEVLLLYDDEALYLGFIAHESHITKIRAEESGRDAFVWRDDAVEAFLDIGDASTAYYQMATNIRGSMFDLLEDRAGNLDFGWNGNWEVKTSLERSSWSAEFRIPFSELGITGTPTGEIWKGNFTRCDYAGTHQNSAWSPTENFHNQDAFREIHFR